MPQRIQAPTGEVIEFPDGMSDADISAVMSREFGGPQTPSAPAPQAAAPQEPPVNAWADVGKSLGAGVLRGGAGLVGLPGDLHNTIIKGLDWAGRKFGMDIPQRGPEDFHMGGADMVRALENNITGPLYQPQTRLGKYAGTIGEFAPGMAMGPVGGARALAGKALTQTVLPGVASEAAGQATEGTALEPYARTAGALAGGLTGAARFGPKGVSQGGVSTGPAINAIKSEADAAFAKSRAGGTVVIPQKTDDIVFEIAKQHAGPFNPKLYPNSAAALEEVVKRRGQPQTIQDLHELRQILQDAAMGKNVAPADAREVRKMLAALDDQLDGLTTAHVSGGDPMTAISSLRQGQKLWARYRKTQEIENIFDAALDKVGANYTQAGLQTAIRQGFRALRKQLRDDPGLAAGWTPAEKDMIKRIVRGGPIENTLRFFGYFSPRGPLTGMGYGAGAWAAPHIAIPLGAGTAASRWASTRMALGEADKLDTMVRTGARPVPKALTGPQKAALALALSGGSRIYAPTQEPR